MFHNHMTCMFYMYQIWSNKLHEDTEKKKKILQGGQIDQGLNLFCHLLPVWVLDE